MPDREKVISHFKDAIATSWDLSRWGFVRVDIIKDAIALLQEKEPVEPEEMVDAFYPIGDPLRTIGWKCGHCGERIACFDSFCPKCGRKVDWDAATD